MKILCLDKSLITSKLANDDTTLIITRFVCRYQYQMLFKILGDIDQNLIRVSERQMLLKILPGQALNILGVIVVQMCQTPHGIRFYIQFSNVSDRTFNIL